VDEGVPLLSVQGLNKAFGGNVVVRDVSFTIEPHQITGLIGPNGAGKTTIFNLVTGFVPQDSGEVWFKGTDIHGKRPHDIVSRGVARTFQELRLFESISVLDNIVLAMQHQPGEQVVPLFLRWLKSNKRERECRTRALELLEFVGLSHLAEAPASDLSYGQQKRAALARVLAADPDLLCLDEPVAGLDPEAIEGAVGLIKELVERQKTILLVEHNLEIVRDICNKVLFMDQGELVVEGPPELVLEDPRVYQGFMGMG
jgi:ABC-type branched-subunit amino acid transport system ATPase component